MPKRYVAVDLGAESGRVIVGSVENGFEFEVINRFPSRNTRVHATLHWDILYIFSKIKEGLKGAVEKYGDEIVSIGVDTWGVDYGLLDSKGALIGNLVHYRDDRTDGMMERLFDKIGKDEIYRETGIQFMQINTLYQLAAEAEHTPQRLAAAERLLFTPDLLNYWLSGVAVNEYSISSTSQLFNPKTGSWSLPLTEAIALNEGLLQPVVHSGTVLGPLHPKLAEELGIKHEIKVVATAGHDTAAAVAAVPSKAGEKSAYLSSGTWSLLGVELPEAVIDAESAAANVTNEGAADGGIRFLKNIMGLWILQECRRSWEAEGLSIDYGELAAEAAREEPLFVLDVDDPRFLKPGRGEDTMPNRILDFAREQGFSLPERPSQFARVIFEGLARAYAEVIEKISRAGKTEIEVLHIIGGGCQNELLNQLTADRAGIPVTAGPVEATALGNIMYQAIAMGELKDQNEGRERIRNAGGIASYTPS